MRQDTTSVTGKYVFTPEETTANTEKLLDVMTEKDQIVEEAKNAAAQYKNKISGKDLEITALRTALANGYEMRPYQCITVKNFDSGYREYRDIVTNELISKEVLTSLDYQTDMNETLGQISAKNAEQGPADQLGLVIEEKVTEANAELTVFDEAAAPEGEEELNLEGREDEPVGDVVEVEQPTENVIPFQQIPREETFSPPKVEPDKKAKKGQVSAQEHLENGPDASATDDQDWFGDDANK